MEQRDEKKKACHQSQAFTGGLYAENMEINVTVYTFWGLFWSDIKKLCVSMGHFVHSILVSVLPWESKKSK